MIGGILVQGTFAACFISMVAFYIYHSRGTPNSLRVARWAFATTVAGVLAISSLFLYYILTHQFQYTYIWSYSSRSLSTPLLISTFYAGQEGSFLLWTLYTTLIGVFLIRYSRKRDYEAAVMSAFTLILLALLGMLVAKNPFKFVWETWPDQLSVGHIPPDGRGLNPLLQNYWMVIHPQILFTGFAAMSVPYAFAIAGLLKKDYVNWIRPATPWLVYGATVLGVGIMLGGFWAYETLGWGGYWAWDPVENSSLVPWLISLAAIHTTLSQRKNGSYMKTNMVLNMMAFIAVLYSTFLTRSGVLGETSVHSFVAPGMVVYWLLIVAIILFSGIGFGLLFLRLRDFPKRPPVHNYLSREFALSLGSITLVLLALFVTIGTSSPIITQILEGKISKVDNAYYLATSVPLGILIGLLAGIGQLLWWSKSDWRELLPSLYVPVALSLLAAIGTAFTGKTSPQVLLFVFATAFALVTNVQVGWRIIKKNPKMAGGSIAHIGFAVMFFGFVGSGDYDEKTTVSLVEGEPTEALGYTLTYSGYRLVDGEKYAFIVKIEKEGRYYQMAPIMYYSSFSEGLMRNPDVLNLISKDLYLAPLSLEQKNSSSESTSEHLHFKRGETKQVGEIEVTFDGFDLSSMKHVSNQKENDGSTVGVRLIVKEYGRKPVTVIPHLTAVGNETSSQPESYEGKIEFSLQEMHPDIENPLNSQIVIIARTLDKSAAPITGAPQKDTLHAEVSLKHLINLVWAGLIILVVGFVITIVRRAKEAALQ